MSLRACERRALRKIETELCRTDPRLRSMFAVFTRLASGAVVHGPENLGAGDGRRIWRRSRPGQLAARPMLRLMVFLSFALALVTCAVLAGGGSVATRCRPAAAPKPGPAAPAGWPVPMGHRFVVPAVSPAPARWHGTACPGRGSQLAQPPLTQP